jgi:hypothetical protein
MAFARSVRYEKLNIFGTGVIVFVAMAVQLSQAAEALKSCHAEFEAYLTQGIVSTIDSGAGKRNDPGGRRLLPARQRPSAV